MKTIKFWKDFIDFPTILFIQVVTDVICFYFEFTFKINVQR